MNIKLWTSLLMTLLLVGCGGAKEEVVPTVEPEVVATPEPTVVVDKTQVNLGLMMDLSGVSGVALMVDGADGQVNNYYNVTMSDNHQELVDGLLDGSLDVATLPANVSAQLYHQTNGQIQALSVLDLGALYVVENGDTVHSLVDLQGKTVYAVGEGTNNQVTLEYMLAGYEIPVDDVDVQWVSGSEVLELMMDGTAQLCMVVEPYVLALTTMDADCRVALDLSWDWSDLRTGTRSMNYATVVVRREYARANMLVVKNIMEDFQLSVDAVNRRDTYLSQGLVDVGILDDLEVAEGLIERVYLDYVSDTNSVMGRLQSYYETLWQMDAQALGGSLPDDGFYY